MFLSTKQKEVAVSEANKKGNLEMAIFFWRNRNSRFQQRTFLLFSFYFRYAKILSPLMYNHPCSLSLSVCSDNNVSLVAYYKPKYTMRL